MKRVIAVAEMLLLMLFLVPFLIVERSSDTFGGEALSVLPANPTPAATPQTIKPSEDDQTIVRVLMEDGRIEEMAMGEYLWSVVAAEMPASFEQEALKAQAVTARTYTAWKMKAGETKHPDAQMCVDINCCQAFISRERAAVNWGTAADLYGEKIQDAVLTTDGVIMTYEGQPIQAVFFSSADGRTEDAVAVWGNSVPYLVGVDSPEGEHVPNYHTEVIFTQQEFREIFLQKYPGADLSGASSGWFQNKELTSSGRVATIDVGGITVKGTEMRSLFGLRSASFTVETTEDQVEFHVTGYGHGVGMSQYGANALAQQGMPWDKILAWYYTGVEIG